MCLLCIVACREAPPPAPRIDTLPRGEAAGPPRAIELVSAAARGAIHVPALGALVLDLRSALAAPQTAPLRDAFEREFALPLTDAAALEARGIALAGDVAVFAEPPHDNLILALRVTDRTRFDLALVPEGTQAVSQDLASVRIHQVNGLRWTHLWDFVAMSRDEAALRSLAERLTSYKRPDRVPSLGTMPEYAELLHKVPGSTATLVARREAERLCPCLAGVPGAMAAGIRWDAGAHVDVWIAGPAELPTVAPKVAESLAGMVAVSAPLVLAAAADWGALRSVPLLGTLFAAATQNLPVPADTLAPALTGNVVFAFKDGGWRVAAEVKPQGAERRRLQAASKGLAQEVIAGGTLQREPGQMLWALLLDKVVFNVPAEELGTGTAAGLTGDDAASLVGAWRGAELAGLMAERPLLGAAVAAAGNARLSVLAEEGALRAHIEPWVP
jgi:hypothetical protein